MSVNPECPALNQTIECTVCS